MGIQEGLALAAAAAPIAVGFGYSRVRGLDASDARRLTASSALASFFFVLGAAACFALVRWVPAAGPSSALLGASLPVAVDGVSVLMLLTIAPIGAVVARYSVRYLDGDPEQARFCQWLALTVGAVLLLAISANLVLLFTAWVVASVGLHRLMIHRSELPRAISAARGRLLVGRAGDAFLLAGFVLLARGFGTTSIPELNALAASAEIPSGLWIAVGAIVVGVIANSVQLPFHAWLPDSMDTPTPVSALMHAGLVNAGGFVLIRLAPVLVEAPGPLLALAAIGAASALFGSLVMLVQTDVKRKLAYSTVSQMGFMMLQCGLGAFGAAALHLIGHAYYKAYAFLAAGSQIDPRGGISRPAESAPPSVGRVLVGASVGLAAMSLASWGLGIDLLAKPGFGLLGIVLLIGVVQIFLLPTVRGRVGRGTAFELGALGAAIVVSYLVGVTAIEALLAGALPAAPGTFGIHGAAFAVGVAVAFLGAWAFQELAIRGPVGPWRKSLYIHASNGFYVGLLQNRLLARFQGGAAEQN